MLTFRVVETVAWLGAASFIAFFGVSLVLESPAPGATEGGSSVLPIVVLFGGVFLYALYMAHKAWQSGDTRTGMPSNPTKRPRAVITKTPLDAADRAALGNFLRGFEDAGVLAPGEVEATRLAALGEHDEGHPFKMYNFLEVLAVYAKEADELDHCVLFQDQVEFYEEDVHRVLAAFLRLSATQNRVTEVALTPSLPIEGRALDRKMDLSFRLDGELRRIVFSMHAKYLPQTLFAGLAPVLEGGGERRFALGVSDQFWMLIYTTTEAIDKLQGLARQTDGSMTVHWDHIGFVDPPQ